MLTVDYFNEGAQLGRLGLVRTRREARPPAQLLPPTRRAAAEALRLTVLGEERRRLHDPPRDLQQPRRPGPGEVGPEGPGTRLHLDLRRTSSTSASSGPRNASATSARASPITENGSRC